MDQAFRAQQQGQWTPEAQLAADRGEDIAKSYPYRLGALAMAARTYLKFGEEQDRKRLAELVNAEFATYPNMKEVS